MPSQIVRTMSRWMRGFQLVAGATLLVAGVASVSLMADPSGEQRGVRAKSKSGVLRARAVATGSVSDNDAVGSIAGGPSNDDCINAILTFEGVSPISTVGATTDGPDEPIRCNVFGQTQIDKDVWYEHQASCDGNLTISLCSENTTFDTRLAIYDGCSRCPTDASALVCNDDDRGCIQTGQSTVVFPVQTGSCYTIRVGAFGMDEGTGDMLIRCDVPPPVTGACCTSAGCIGTFSEATCDSQSGTWFEGETCPLFTCPPPPNDQCMDAIEVFTDVPQAGFTGGATGSDLSQFCAVTDLGDVWHFWTADCTGTSTISLCDTPIPFDSTLSAFDACDGNELGCDDDECGLKSVSELPIDVVRGETYYIRVAGFEDPDTGVVAAGEYTLTVGDCTDPTPRACCGGPNIEQCINDTKPVNCLRLLNGTPQAPGTVCGGTFEACCFDDGSCTDMDTTCCLGQRGTPAGVASECLTDTDNNGTDDVCEGLIDTFVWKDFNGDAFGGYLPDFDQNQDFDNADNDGDPNSGMDDLQGGPAAAADLLWWLDAKYPSLGVVEASVSPLALIGDLAFRMATNAQPQSAWGHPSPYGGTWIDDLKTGVRSYLNAHGLSDVFNASILQAPTYAEVSDGIIAGDNIVLLLGFYHVESATDIPGSGFLVNWRRTGGHYVSVAGTDPNNMGIALSDPDADAAEESGRGVVRGADHNHDGDGNPGTNDFFRDPTYDHAKHNDKGLSSQDVYLAMPATDPGGGPPPIAGGAWILTVEGDPLRYGAETSPFHVESSGGAFDLDAGSFMSDDFLLESGFPDPVHCQTYTVVEAAFIISSNSDQQACCFGDGTCSDQTPTDCALLDGVHRGPDTVCLGDADVSGSDDICEACASVPIAAVLPPDGTLDARQPHGPDAALPRLGIGTPTEPIRIATAAPVPGFARCLRVCESDVDPILGPNALKRVTEIAPNQFEMVLEHAIAAGAVTTLAFDGGSIDYTAHPSNVGGDAVASEGAVATFIDCCLNATCGPGWGRFRCDVNRSGGPSPADLLRVIDLLEGAAAWDSWFDSQIPPPSVPCP